MKSFVFVIWGIIIIVIIIYVMLVVSDHRNSMCVLVCFDSVTLYIEGSVGFVHIIETTKIDVEHKTFKNGGWILFWALVSDLMGD